MGGLVLLLRHVVVARGGVLPSHLQGGVAPVAPRPVLFVWRLTWLMEGGICVCL